jgi:integrase
MSKMQKATGPRMSGITVYPRGRRWAFIIYGEPDLLTGKRERVYRGGFTEDADAWSAAIRVKSELGAGSYLHPSRRTVRDFLREWLTTVEHSIKPTTYANYADNVNAYVLPVLGDRKLQEITVPVLNAFYRQLLEVGRRKVDTNTAMYEYWKARRHRRDGLGPPPKEISMACGTTIYAARTAVGRYRRGRVPQRHSDGLAPKSVKNVHRLLHRALSDAVAWQYLSTNPAAHASLPRERRGVDNRPKPWTVDELAIWLRVALTDRFAGIWVLAATTGMRRSELAGVQRDLLNLETGTLTIGDTRVVVDGNAAESDGKTNSGRRTISLDAFTVAALRGYVDLLEKERAEFGATYPDHGRLLCFTDGRQLHPDTITRRFNRLVDRAGVRHIRLHDIRHTYSTVALDAGIDPKLVSDRVGHANMNVTFQIYAHRSTGQDRAAAEQVTQLIAEAVGGGR